ncbi:hypothetical protein BDV93DRAFT_410897, partial [Ceratobasidium sp. AG-I]
VQIVSYLHPGDLCSLARTNKLLRKRLMTRFSAFMWRRSFSNVEGLPDSPFGMSLPAYAALIFTPWCSV